MLTPKPWPSVLIAACLSGPAIAAGVDLFLAPRFAVAIDHGADDAQAAMLAGLEKEFAGIRLGAYEEFEYRVYGKDRIVPVTPTLRMQYQELRYSLGAGAYAALPLGRNPRGGIGWPGEARLGGGMGYSLGEYRGTEAKAESRWVPWVDAGYGWRCGALGKLILGYQYRPLPHASPHRASLAYGVLLPLGSGRKTQR